MKNFGNYFRVTHCRSQETGANIIATACPFCMTMLTDGIKYKNKEEEVKNYDIAELIAMALGI